MDLLWYSLPAFHSGCGELDQDFDYQGQVEDVPAHAHVRLCLDHPRRGHGTPCLPLVAIHHAWRR